MSSIGCSKASSMKEVGTTTDAVEPTAGAEPTDAGGSTESSKRADLFAGWDWASLLKDPIVAGLEASGSDLDPDQVAATLASELAPLENLIDRTLFNRANEASHEERIAALEKKILLLRQVNELLLAYCFARIETLRLRTLRRAKRSGTTASLPKSTTRSLADETAAQLAARRRLISR